MALVESKNLQFAYGSHRVLDGLDFAVEPGESVGIIGCNGAGKSTLLKLLCGIELNYTGQLLVAGASVRQNTLAALRQKLGYVFQDSESQLFMTTVYEDVAFAPENSGLPPAEVKRRTLDALRRVHMEAFAGERIYRLSGGQKKLASIATVLSMQPELLLLDEPSVALDPQNRRNLMAVLNSLPTAKLIASHDLDFIFDTCTRAILIAGGRAAADGPAQVLLRDRALLEANGLELPLSFSRGNG